MNAWWFTMMNGRTWVQLNYGCGRIYYVWLIEFDTAAQEGGE